MERDLKNFEFCDSDLLTFEMERDLKSFEFCDSDLLTFEMERDLKSFEFCDSDLLTFEMERDFEFLPDNRGFSVFVIIAFNKSTTSFMVGRLSGSPSQHSKK
jgi:hypothetical protein